MLSAESSVSMSLDGPNGKEEWLLGGLNVCDGADLGGLVPLMVETLCMFHGLTASTP